VKPNEASDTQRVVVNTEYHKIMPENMAAGIKMAEAPIILYLSHAQPRLMKSSRTNIDRNCL
jgi:hypothetical protein